MQINTGVILAIAIFAIIIIAVLIVFRHRVSITIQSILGNLAITGSNRVTRPQRGAHVENATSKQGNVTARDRSGHSATVREAKALGDITAEVDSAEPKDKHPKA